MKVQGADGITRDVPVDSIVGQDYDVPVYKLTIGDEGDDDGMVSATNPMPVTAVSAVLPDDAATETKQDVIIGHVDNLETLVSDVATATKQDTIIGHIDGIETLLNGGLPEALGAGGGLKIDGSGTALPISAASLPLPTGAATESTLSTLNGKVITNAANTARTTSTIVLPVQIVDSAGRSPKVDSITKAQMTIDYSHHEMHSGSFYFVKGWADVDGAGTNLDFLWVVPNTAAWPHATWEIAGEAEFTLYLYEDVTTVADGASVAAINANRNSGNTSGVATYSGPTLDTGALGDGGNGGTLIWAGKIGSGKNATGDRRTSNELIGKQNAKYWFRINKEAAGTHWIDYYFGWYEHTNG